MRKFFNFMFIFIILFSWYGLIDLNKDRLESYNTTKELADTYYKKEIYDEALNEYKKLEKIKQSQSIQESIVKSYIKLGKKDKALEYIKTSIIKKDTKNIYLKDIFEAYLKDREYKYFNNNLNKLDEKDKSFIFPLIEGGFEKLKKEFVDLKIKDSVKKVLAVKNDKWKLINSNGKNITKEIYEKIYDFDDTMVVANLGGRTSLYSLEGNLKGEFETSDPVYICKEDIYLHSGANESMYVDRLGKQIKKVEKGSVFSQDKMAVIKDKGWKLVDENLNFIENIKAKNIKFNSFMEAIFDDLVIVKNKAYRLYDIKSKKYSQDFEDIDFPGGGLIAVKKFGKWGYIDRDFRQIIECKFKSAKSFKSGLGVVKDENDKFFLINKNKEKVGPEVSGMVSINNNGIGFLRRKDRYRLIRLKRYIYENY